MTNKTEVLKTDVRTKVGSRHARKLRKDGMIPCAIGADDKHPHLDIAINEHEFMGARRRHSHLFELEIGGERAMALVRELTWDVFGDSIVHIDFKRVQRDVKTESQVELEFIGHPKGGVLNHLITHVTVMCIPSLIPDVIEVPVDKLEPGGAIYARDLKAPEGVEIKLAPDTRVAVVVVAKIEVEPVAAAEAGATVAAPATPAAPEKGEKGDKGKG
jgi:large subunit ribosomal protein L25